MTKDMDIDLEIEADEVAYIYLGTDKHNNLKNLDLPDSHPIKAITGLQEVVDKVGRTEDGAEVNEIVGVRVNGVPLDIAGDRTVDVVVPTSYGYTLDLDGETGIISLKDRDGVVLSTIDTNLERIVESGRYDAETNELVLVLDDGSEIRIDASRLVDVYTADGETIVESGHVFALSKGSKDALKDSADHIADRSNPHNVTKDQIGLSNVDNTSDMGKPISTLMQQALDGKADDSAVVHKAGDTMTGTLQINNGILLVKKSSIESNNTATTQTEVARFVFRANDNSEISSLISITSGTENKSIIRTSRKIDGVDVSSDLVVGILNTKEQYVSGPTPKSASDNTGKFATTRWVNGASTLVHTTGSETIAGAKLFSSNITVEKNYIPAIVLRNTGSSVENPPSTQADTGYTFEDANGYQIGSMYTRLGSNGSIALNLQTKSNKSGSEKKSVISIYNGADGTVYATAPATADTHPDNTIVTKKYLLDKIATLEARLSALEGAR